jgi:hypothetical protein
MRKFSTLTDDDIRARQIWLIHLFERMATLQHLKRLANAEFNRKLRELRIEKSALERAIETRCEERPPAMPPLFDQLLMPNC